MIWFGRNINLISMDVVHKVTFKYNLETYYLSMPTSSALSSPFLSILLCLCLWRVFVRSLCVRQFVRINPVATAWPSYTLITLWHIVYFCIIDMIIKSPFLLDLFIYTLWIWIFVCILQQHYLSVGHPEKSEENHQMPWNWSCTWLWAGIRLLGINSGSGRPPITLNH